MGRPFDGGGSQSVAAKRIGGQAISAATNRKTTSTVRRYSAPRRTGTSSGYSGRSSSRSSGSSSSRSSSSSSTRRAPVKAPAKPVVRIPDINSYLGTDSAYQNVVRGGKRSLADFISELGRRRGEATTQYNMTSASMERDRTQQLEDLREEFASRGLIQSGLYGEEQGRFQKQFTEQANALKQQQASLLADLLSQQKNYQREQDLSLEAAKQEALQRRAAKFKIG